MLASHSTSAANPFQGRSLKHGSCSLLSDISCLIVPHEGSWTADKATWSSERVFKVCTCIRRRERGSNMAGVQTGTPG